MSTKIRISVTKEILEKSKMCGWMNSQTSPVQGCAVALACADVFPRCNVSGHYIRPIPSEDLQIDLPDEATEFIRLFDKTPCLGRPLLPSFSFEIQIPDEVIAKINIDEIRPLLINHPTLELIEQ